MFVTFHNSSGEIVFENDNFYLCVLNHNGFESKDPKAILETAVSLPSAEGLRIKTFFTPRYPRFLFVSKDKKNHTIKNADIQDMEKKASGEGLGSALLNIISLVNEHKGKRSSIDAGEIFLSSHVGENDSLTITHSELTDYPGNNMIFVINGKKFAIRITNPKKVKVNGVYMLNEFESIFIPLHDDEKRERALRMVQNIINRSEMPGRISHDYFVFPSSWDGRIQVKLRAIPEMKTKEMLSYFRHDGNKADSKVATLSECMKTLTKKTVPVLEVGERIFIQLGTKDVHDMPYQALPTDWVLARGSHLKILSCEQDQPHRVRMIVEIMEQPVDGFAQAWYTLQDVQKNSIKIVALRQESLDRLFEETRKKVNS
ncbi:MAG: hypothetical protein ACXACY_13355 [Candidatus Hodarchaeales archaeon]|jgi:cytochrome oxidase assembly protein ShyY1